MSDTYLIRSQIPTTSGIYAIVNLVNGKRYVGSTSNFRHRWDFHRGRLRVGKHYNRHLQSAWNKHGEENFRFVILEYVFLTFIVDAEQRHLDANCGGYNIAKYADTPTRGLKLGPRPPEVRAKIAAASRLRRHSAKTRAQISAAGMGKTNAKGHQVSLEARAKISAALKGHFPSAETRAKLSAAHKGHEVSTETRAKISAGRTGIKHTPEAKLKISIAGKKRSERERLIGKCHSGSKLTEESVREIRESHACGDSLRSLARRYAVDHGTITNAVRRKTWAHIL